MASFNLNTKLVEDPLINVCREAADRNVQLLCQLLDSLSPRNLTFAMYDIHYGFNAAIILELRRLLTFCSDNNNRDNKSYNKDAPFQTTLQIRFIRDMLRSAGQYGKGNDEFSRDCFMVLEDFHQLCEKLGGAISRATTFSRTTPTITGIPLQEQQHPNRYQQESMVLGASVSANGFEQPQFVNDDGGLGTTPGELSLTTTEYGDMFDEFMTWLDCGNY